MVYTSKYPSCIQIQILGAYKRYAGYKKSLLNLKKILRKPCAFVVHAWREILNMYCGTFFRPTYKGLRSFFFANEQ